ncbi:phenoloxidase-activating factor 2 [Caerostris extrusa]|uniref:Phenoloxidase-activating factor 2 n=1 Tax=Caerostris extrusa TaxID=172846 RepID=A0AAV4U9Q6_CAEEX|nr:phenoloxidase-activating factor 2 [Caerostris extrusa]
MTEGRDSLVEAETLAPYTEDIMARMIGLNNVGDSCGLLRRCCKVPLRGGAPGGLLPFSPDNYPIPPTLQGTSASFPGALAPRAATAVPRTSSGAANHPRSPRGAPPPATKPSTQTSVPTTQATPALSTPPSSQETQPQPLHQTTLSSEPPIPLRGDPSDLSSPFTLNSQSNVPPQPDFGPQPQVNQGQCGARNGLGIHGRVNNLQYHDDASEFGEYPWQAAILLKVGPGNNLFVCGGTLISDSWVATAAHCLKTLAFKYGRDLRCNRGCLVTTSVQAMGMRYDNKTPGRRAEGAAGRLGRAPRRRVLPLRGEVRGGGGGPPRLLPGQPAERPGPAEARVPRRPLPAPHLPRLPARAERAVRQLALLGHGVGQERLR